MNNNNNNNTRKQTASENFRMVTRGNAKEGKTQIVMDRWSDRRGY
jgi:hypothetical protein